MKPKDRILRMLLEIDEVSSTEMAKAFVDKVLNIDDEEAAKAQEYYVFMLQEAARRKISPYSMIVVIQSLMLATRSMFSTNDQVLSRSIDFALLQIFLVVLSSTKEDVRAAKRERMNQQKAVPPEEEARIRREIEEALTSIFNNPIQES